MKPESKTFVLAVGVSIIGLVFVLNIMYSGALLQPMRRWWQTRQPPVLATQTGTSPQNFIHILPALISAFESDEVPEADTTSVGGNPPTGGGTTNPGGTNAPIDSGTLPTGTVDASQVVDVQGIEVHQSIAGTVNAMLTAARGAGINLSGWGWRDPETQIELRKQNCGTSNYAIYQMPSGQCSPPTAIPGTSNHERGLAIDFVCDNTGDTVRGYDECFAWLSANAGAYGFYNLPSESWHWSVDGH